MKKITVLLLAAVSLSTLTGCLSKASNDLVPKTAFKVQEAKDGKSITGEFPKDMNIGLAEFRKDDKSTSLVLSNVVSATNPDVIKESGTAQAAAIQAMGELYKENLRLMKELLQEGAKATSPTP